MHLRFIGLGLIGALGISGCAEYHPPAPRPVIIPVIQRQAFEEGMKAYQDRDYPNAVRKFEDVIGRFPGSPLLEESQWMIGKSYEADGQADRAVKEYRSFLANYPDSAHQYEAKLRIDFLEGLLHERTAQRTFVTHYGLILNGDPENAAARWKSEMPSIPAGGLPTVVLSGYGDNGVYFKTSQAPVIHDSIPEAVKAAHARGYRIWIRLPARHMPWFKVPGDERDLRFEPVGKKTVLTSALDLFNPMTLNRLKAFYGDLASTGADGIVIEEEAWIEPLEGFSPAARAAFAQDFGEPLDPARLISPASVKEEKSFSPETAGTPLFWRWAGWRNREMLNRLSDVWKSVRADHPGLVLVRFIPSDSLVKPNVALARSGIDLLEEKQHGFDYFGVALSFDAKREEAFAILGRMIEFIGDSKRVIARLPMADKKQAVSFLTDFQGAGVLFAEALKRPAGPLTRRHQ
jgi:tetratricopeptide (TPR) repeat protein